MNHRILNKRNRTEVGDLFTSAFGDSEGEEEGQLIGNLASTLCSNIDNQEIICLGAYENEMLLGAIFFTYLHFSSSIRVYMLAPVAVATAQQGKGVGQALIRHGLGELRNRSVEVVITYGDPAFYSKMGFQPLSEDLIQAPLKLSMPHGWLGQSLTGAPIPAIEGRPACVRAFDDPVYW